MESFLTHLNVTSRKMISNVLHRTTNGMRSEEQKVFDTLQMFSGNQQR